MCSIGFGFVHDIAFAFGTPRNVKMRKSTVRAVGMMLCPVTLSRSLYFQNQRSAAPRLSVCSSDFDKQLTSRAQLRFIASHSKSRVLRYLTPARSTHDFGIAAIANHVDANAFPSVCQFVYEHQCRVELRNPVRRYRIWREPRPAYRKQ